MSLTIRRAERGDLPAIREIYNYAVRELTATFDTEEKSLADREAWFAEHGQRYPIFVAVEGETVVGWASLSRYQSRCAWSGTVEDSVCLHPDHCGHGIGTRLLAALMHAARDLGYHVVVAQIVGDNAGSIRLHEKFGFAKVGVMHEVGRKFGRWQDVLIMEALLEEKEERA